MSEYMAFSEGIKKNGQFIGAPAHAYCHRRALPQREDFHDRRPVYGDKRAARRLLPHRSEGSERCNSGWRRAGDLYRRLGSRVDAIAAYKRSLALATQEPARRFISRRLDELRLTSPR